MSSYRRTYACEDCGKSVSRLRGTRNALICSDCSLTRVIESARQMAEKRGPYYDAWLKSAGPTGRRQTTDKR